MKNLKGFLRKSLHTVTRSSITFRCSLCWLFSSQL
ncbi:unnamed protein product [Cylicostephanus goldi]|uniref:Uncharacterized protein n=1 Tax=Cylicostephanus goldi TaxID=71465 RepID=A0A3P7MQV7_CYLGO|nr:unnamed protein product [Cylicostephanus goldi]